MATEAETEVQKVKELEERIRAPTVYSRLAVGVRIEDLQDNRYEEAVTFLKEHYLNEEITWRSVKILEDKESLDEFVHCARIWFKDKISFAVVEEGSSTLVGLLVMRLQEKAAFSRVFSRTKLTYSPLYSQVMTFINAVEKPVDIFDELGVRRYLKIFLMAVTKKYRHRGVIKEMLRCTFDLAKTLKIPAVSGIFTTSSTQALASALGFTKYHELYYARYQDGDKVVFMDTGSGNYGTAVMAARVNGVIESEENLNVQKSDDNENLELNENLEENENLEGVENKEEITEITIS